MHYGIDVSSFQGSNIDWTTVVAELRSMGGGAQPFVFVKITEGTNYINPDWSSQFYGAKNAGAAVGGYLFDHGSDSPSAENSYFLSVLSGEPAALDIESADGLTAGQYASHVQSLFSLEPKALVYLNQAEVAEGLLPSGASLWLAQYNDNPTSTAYNCLVHQYWDAATINGISGQVDINAWLGTDAQFDAFFNVTSSTSTQKVNPMFNPPIDINSPVVCELNCPSGGFWLLTQSGAVYGFAGAPYYGAANGQPYWGTRQAATLTNITNSSGDPGYCITDTVGETYNYYK